MTVKQALSSLMLCISMLFMAASCAITPDTIHGWGRRGNYDSIREEMRKNPSEDIRIACAMELGKGNYVFGIPDLVTLSRDQSPRVRIAAVEGLGQYAGAEVYNAIIQCTGDANEEVSRAAEAVLRTWSTEAVGFVLDAMKDRNYRVRAAAARMLAVMKDSRAGQALVQAAQSDDSFIVRREAVRAIATMGYQPGKKTLYRLKYTDTSPEVSIEAEQALKKLGGNVFAYKVVVLPFRSTGGFGERAAAMVGPDLSSALSGGAVCTVIGATVPAPEPGVELVKWAFETGKSAGADQVIFGQVLKDGDTMVIRATREDLTDTAIVQHEESRARIGDERKAVDALVKSLVSRFE